MRGFTTLRGQIRRRLLVSYRVDPVTAQGLLPDMFRPQIIDGSAVGGVCLIGLQSARPGWLRPPIGFSTENVAHRIAVEWDQNGETRTGVYIIERHSSTLGPVLAGGRLFPGVQKRARFHLDETESRFRVNMVAPGTHVSVDVQLGGPWTSTLFPTIEDVSSFYQQGAVGWSPRRDDAGVEPLQLTSPKWDIEQGQIFSLRSSYFDALPEGTATFDSVVVMRDVPAFWSIPQAQPDSTTRRLPHSATV